MGALPSGYPPMGRESRSTRGSKRPRDKRSRSISMSPPKEPVIHYERKLYYILHHTVAFTDLIVFYFLVVDVPSKYVYNDFVMDSDWDLQTAFDSARFSKILLPADLKSRDLGVQLYEVK